jgi:hypothetical protein
MEVKLQERKKLGEIFKILELSEKEVAQHMDALGESLLMDVVAEALSHSEEGFSGEIESKNDVANFLLKNYSSEEIKSMTDLVFRDVVVEYFSKLMKDVEDEKVAVIEEILDSIE